MTTATRRRRAPAVRARRRRWVKTRRRITRIGRSAPVRDLRDSITWVRQRTRTVHCGACKPVQRVPRSQLRVHMQMHEIMNRERHKQGKQAKAQHDAGQARRQQEENAGYRDGRPRNKRSGLFAPATRPQDRETPSQVKWVNADGSPSSWRPGDPYPDIPTPGLTEPESGQQDPPPGVRPKSWLDDLTPWDGRGSTPVSWWRTGHAPRTPESTRPKPDRSRGGARWKARTTNPGTDNPRGHVPFIHGPTDEKEPTVASPAPTGGGSKPTGRPRGGGKSGASGNGGGGGGEVGMTSAANAWAARLPEELDRSKADTDAMAQDLHGVGDALRRRAQMEVERGMGQDCVEPLEAAARLLSQAGEQVQEVTVRQEARYRQLADELSKRDTPTAAYLSPENVARGR